MQMLRNIIRVMTFGDSALQAEVQGEVGVQQGGAIPVDDVTGRYTAQVAQAPLWRGERERERERERE